MEQAGDNWRVARELVAAGLRPPQVQALTGVTAGRLRDLYKAANGVSATPGQKPVCAPALIKNQKQAVEAAMFLTSYDCTMERRGRDGCREVDPRALLEAYRAYRVASVSPMPISAALCLVLNLANDGLETRRCPKCGSRYLSVWNREALSACALC